MLISNQYSICNKENDANFIYGIVRMLSHIMDLERKFYQTKED